MPRILERTVLFADLRGSTGLFERLGNAAASTLVTGAVGLIGECVERGGGHVVKTLGDGLMAVFEDATRAVAAADAMHLALQRPPRGSGAATAASVAAGALKLQVAMARGEVVEIESDCFGDAVNVAARLLDHAGDNETLVTVDVLAGLQPSQQVRFRALDRLQLRGRAEPVQVHLLQSRQAVTDGAATQFGDALPLPGEPEALRLKWRGQERIFATAQLPLVLGRSPQAGCCIDDSRVSRSHARIDWHGGAFQFTDLSFNGSYVRFAHDRAVLSLRRGSCTLHGSGEIGLGVPPGGDASAPVLHFEVLRLGEDILHAAGAR
ncbi:adenylate/guanylate cyclase domain-containing protein [Azohydromonas australica]|uniref:adenylate/guanylate cyclase domain-containing protein n=1 Tax=Azohydromonas australica TaxID=364039 RepID=UPI00040476F1|nr:adenylate/guanylate cyclase domain-containing protein [Azohydromonas australica]